MKLGFFDCLILMGIISILYAASQWNVILAWFLFGAICLFFGIRGGALNGRDN